MESYYRNQLSPFGRDVLDIMIRNWRKDRAADLDRRRSTNTVRHNNMHLPHPRDSKKNRRILTFNDAQQSQNVLADPALHNNRLSAKSTLCMANEELEENDDIPFEFIPVHPAALPAVPTSLQLVTPAVVALQQSQPASVAPPPRLRYSTYDLLTSTSHTSKACTSDFVTNLYNEAPKSKSDNILQLQATFVEPDSKMNTIVEPRCEELQKTDVYKVTQYNLFANEANINECNDTSQQSDKRTSARFEDLDTEPKEINWDNIFDTEILSQAALLKDVAQENFKSDLNNKLQSDMPAIETFVCSTSRFSDGNSNKIQIISNEVIQPGKLKKKISSNKRKTQTKNTDAEPKKMKKIPSECKKILEPTFRKQSYKKTVHNWLESVTPCQVIDEQHEDPLSENPIKRLSPKNNGKPADEIKSKAKEDKKSKGDNNKKVQAQLANKDGVMKFKRPNLEVEQQGCKPTSDSTECSKPEIKATDIAVINKSKDTGKDKKVKSKFKVPFKANSQIPIKDITYDIVLIDGKNYAEHLDDFASVENDKEIIFILVYRNGFNQLNRHHTDDSCVPEGLMLLMDEKFYYIKHTDIPNSTAIRELFISILTTKKVICYDGKEILIYLAAEYKLDLVEQEMIMEDTQIGGRLLEADEPPLQFSALLSVAGHVAEYRVQSACPLQRGACLARHLRDVASTLRHALAQQNLNRVFWDIEMRILPIIADMEHRGVRVDAERLRQMEGSLLERMQQVEADCYRAAGKTFQINSAPQVRALLYEELRLDAQLQKPVPTTHGTGVKSTAESVLRQLAASGQHELPRLVLEYRRLHKARSTFLTGVLQHVTARTVRPVWEQTAAATGRAACSGPNLQAIPKASFPLAVRADTTPCEWGPGLRLRSVYVARAGCTLLAADFRHVECRVFAHVARDQTLLHALAQPGDLFKQLAHQWLHKPVAEVTSEERERTKRVVYASLYGAGAGKLAAMLAAGDGGDGGDGDGDEGGGDAHTTVTTLDVVASFHRAFPSLRSFGRSVSERCLAAGGRLAAASGRARRLAGVCATDPAARAHAHRQALNFIIQGTAADLCKLALADSYTALRAAIPPLTARLALMVHDELVWELPPQQLSQTAEIIRAAMEGCGRQLGIHVPLPVSLAHGPSWGELQPLP